MIDITSSTVTINGKPIQVDSNGFTLNSPVILQEWAKPWLARSFLGELRNNLNGIGSDVKLLNGNRARLDFVLDQANAISLPDSNSLVLEDLVKTKLADSLSITGGVMPSSVYTELFVDYKIHQNLWNSLSLLKDKISDQNITYSRYQELDTEYTAALTALTSTAITVSVPNFSKACVYAKGSSFSGNLFIHGDVSLLLNFTASFVAV